MKKIVFGAVFAFCVLLFSYGFATIKQVDVFLAGTGVVGSRLLEQIEQNHDMLQENYSVDIRLIGIANSRTYCIIPQGIAPNSWRDTLQNFGTPMNWEQFQLVMHKGAVFVDCTSDQQIADSYTTLLQSDIALVTASKKAASGTWDYYQKLKAPEFASRFFYDANVGAGLPILDTIRNLRKGGDRIVKIEAILSGTLSYIFNSFKEGTTFSGIVQDAQNKGYTEPDPRDDLNGMDVARKLLILAREAGFTLEMQDIYIQPFLPADCFEGDSVQDFYAKLATYDTTLTATRRQAEAKHKKLRFIASFEEGKTHLAVQQVGPEHPFYNLSGNDNIVSITTAYYNKNPLVIQGPGAGADVTAARVLEGIVAACTKTH